MKQDRGTFLLGISHRRNINFTEVDSYRQLRMQLEDLVRRIRSGSEFADEKVPPAITAYVVEQSKLGPLVVDEWIWQSVTKDAKPLLWAIPKELRESWDFLLNVRER